MFNRLNHVEWTQLLQEAPKKKVVCKNCDQKIVVTRGEITYDCDLKVYTIIPKNLSEIPLGWIYCVKCHLVYGMRYPHDLKIIRAVTRVLLYDETERYKYTIE